MDTVTIKEIVGIDEYKERKETEWKSAVSLIKDPPLLIAVKLVIGALFLAGAITIIVLRQNGILAEDFFFVIALLCGLVFVYLASTALTNIFHGNRVTRIYYKRVRALLKKELDAFDPTDGIETVLSVGENFVTLTCSQEGSILKDIKAKTTDIQVNEFGNFITVDFNKTDTYTFPAELGRKDTALLRKIFREKANSYTYIEKDRFGKYRLESMKIEK